MIAWFLDEEFGLVPAGEDPRPWFRAFWERERKAALAVLVESEELDPAQVQALLSEHAFTVRAPLRDAMVDAMNVPPRLLERRTRAERVWSRLRDHIDTFVEELG